MYTAPETFYRDAAGALTTEPGEGREMVAVAGAVMSLAEARERGLVPSEQTEPALPDASEDAS